MTTDQSQVRIAGSYIIGRVLGEGGHGSVRLAQHKKTEEQFAIKVVKLKDLHTERESIESAAVSLQKLKHTNIVQLRELIPTRHCVFLVFEYASGGNLKSLLESKIKLPVEQSFRYIYTILSALEYCHASSIYHWNFSIDSVLFDVHGRIKIIGVGLASIYKRDKLLESVGVSPHYSSPEVVTGNFYDGAAADIWSCGVLLYYLCSGQLPFARPDPATMVLAITSASYQVPEFFENGLSQFISTMLTADWEKRAKIQQLKQHTWCVEMCSKLGLNTDTINKIDEQYVPQTTTSTTSLVVNEKKTQIQTADTDTKAGSAPTTSEQSESDPSMAGPYQIGKKIGQGSVGVVMLAEHIDTHEKVAIKVIKKEDMSKSAATRNRVSKEATILRNMDHPNVLRLIDVIHTRHHLFMVLEYAPGGDLLSIIQKSKLPVDTAFNYFHTIVSTLEYCHINSICHRDLKPENVLLDGNGNLKISDFGLANFIKKEKLLETSCGSPQYSSPEKLKGLKYDGAKSDIWSCGIILYFMCAGKPPFDEPNPQRLLRKVQTGEYVFPDYFENGLKEIITMMLTVDMNARASIAQIKQHYWWVEMCTKNGLETQINTDSGGVPSDELSDSDASDSTPGDTAPDDDMVGPYKMGRTIGKGANGKVKLAIHTPTGQQVAIKLIKSQDMVQSPDVRKSVEREIDMLCRLRHPNVLQLFDVLNTQDHLMMVLEYAPGGDLFEKLKKGPIGIDLAFEYFHTILLTISFCHSMSICHRDLKPENVLLDSSGKLKIADFGLANLIPKTKLLETSCGSPHYVSPEIVKGLRYDGTKSDIWSCGVILYFMCSGELPFTDNNLKRLLTKVERGDFVMHPSFPLGLQDFISRILTVDYEKRANIAQLVSHPWWLEMCKKLKLHPRSSN